MRTNSVVCMHACMYDGKCIHLYVVFLCLLLICLIVIRSFYLNIELFYANLLLLPTFMHFTNILACFNLILIFILLLLCRHFSP